MQEEELNAPNYFVLSRKLFLIAHHPLHIVVLDFKYSPTVKCKGCEEKNDTPSKSKPQKYGRKPYNLTFIFHSGVGRSSLIIIIWLMAREEEYIKIRMYLFYTSGVYGPESKHAPIPYNSNIKELHNCDKRLASKSVLCCKRSARNICARWPLQKPSTRRRTIFVAIKQKHTWMIHTKYL